MGFPVPGIAEYWTRRTEGCQIQTRDLVTSIVTRCILGASGLDADRLRALDRSRPVRYFLSSARTIVRPDGEVDPRARGRRSATGTLHLLSFVLSKVIIMGAPG
jgi:hypothetical protein